MPSSLFPLSFLRPNRNYPLAASLAVLVFAGWPVSDAFLKMAREAGVPQGEILLICGVASMATLFVFTAARGMLDHLKPNRWRGLVLLGLLQLAGFVYWMAALLRLPLANMYIVSFLAPLVVACFSSVILKESLDWKRWAAIAMGFVGVIFAVNLHLSQNDGSWLPYLFLFGNMLASATQMFLLRLVSDKEKSESTAFYSRLILAMGGILLCSFTGFTSINPSVFLALCSSGVLGGIGWALLAEAYKYAPAAAVAPFQYTQIIWGALLGYFIWGDLPTPHLLFGSAIIIASALYLFQQEKRISRTMPRID
ncbi:MAG: DMT family transporter [Alphaproteobacteria bacterium]|nr:DMT family transporter [Alphaproteobacteria bacterium]